MQTDASGPGLVPVLLKGEGEDKMPVLNVSRKLFPCETRYSTIKECLAIKWAKGKEFVLETDHGPLQWLHRMQDFKEDYSMAPVLAALQIHCTD